MSRQPKPWFRSDRNAWFVTIAGTRHNLGPNKKEALQKFHALMREPTRQTVVQRSFAAVADTFLEWVRCNRSPHTFEWYRYRVERFCQRFSDLQVDDLKPHHVQQWVDSYKELSKTSRRNYFRSVKRCVAWAVQQGYMARDPLKGLEVPGSERREIMITQEEFEKMLQLIPDPTLRELCQVTYETGCRPQESLRLEAKHVELGRERWVFPVMESKGKRAPRIVYLSSFAREVSQRLASQHPQGLLFRNRSGSPWTVSAVNCAFKRLHMRMAKANMKAQGVSIAQAIERELETNEGLRSVQFDRLNEKERRFLTRQAVGRYATKYSLYALRHAWATKALKSGLDALTVAVLMGHSDPSTLSRVYQHLAHSPEYMLSQARKAAGQDTDSSAGK